ncbi:MAG: hypothetical protein A3C80_01980 [Candidatus Ryanbacteria bacterium RIFCSPHIGHO2_02_FULL_45_43]|uniref:Uncharacterized protein n=1 Tax=Candidatus Ryanbacteria bacterium RIFCSPHIGHO2_01_45_13 TaxID=1802112 RepID=A0A1G2FY65_9BACT|nr:MAG: hypothetical protein A2718_02810 [Candidatus Ryanbacteria bacterium RIFCSPHIGHO2_01_FULL_44_130]OGZ43009.1 MAG: hypothetical protein A2W41_02755 [Candidatus Ryanbacteria bacterium RIFCSPHIGHO2_01_45_13]OGZ48714.1 MAG: hypothetical protein A3C80_01980 [Candidatus Ryanbacteria bacterium RIFCSPHIGHO2_02_FULL_45_43]OGZ50654.1 MAG: hypothetical protein A3E55_03460 [Candidatus Ryanbacteria bacterium RIFCSPHIGHO2_12_FULL_44_20]OGZ51960.1 MAG: hypothetical protein A3A17_00835 [Candidatus Ryanba
MGIDASQVKGVPMKLVVRRLQFQGIDPEEATPAQLRKVTKEIIEHRTKNKIVLHEQAVRRVVLAMR